MKTIRLETMYEYNDGSKTEILAHAPSKSFLRQARIALTEQLSERVEDPVCKAHLADSFDVYINWNWFSWHKERHLMLPLVLEPKSDAFLLLEFFLTWEFRQPGRESVPYPWMEYADGELRFQIVADPFDVRKMNAEIPMVAAPVIRKGESGLPFDYQIRTTDGTVQITFRNAVTDADLKTVEGIADAFFRKYNETREDKIHNMEQPQIYREKNVRFNVDFGGAPIGAVTELIFSFRSVDGIKKIVIQ